MSNGKIAICRSGGGVDGLDIHAGIWRALEDRGIVGDELHGTSAGAIATAADAANWGSMQFYSVVGSLEDTDVRDPRVGWPLRLMWVPSIWGGKKIKALLRDLFPETWGELRAKWRQPAHVYATRIGDAECVDMMTMDTLGWANGVYAESPRDAIYASLAIPCVLPPYSYKGHGYRDGGIRRNLPLPANWREYEHIYLCVASGKRAKYADANDTLSQALTLLQQFVADGVMDVLEETRGATNVTLIWPEPESRGGMLRFDHDLRDAAYEHALEVLKGQLSQDQVLAAGVCALANNGNWRD